MEQMSFELMAEIEREIPVLLQEKERHKLVALMASAIVAVYRAAKERSDEDHDE